MPQFGARSEANLIGVHPDLVGVLRRAILRFDFTVLNDGGVRTLERQRELVAEKKSKTLNSKHLVQPDGYGHAVDIAPYPVIWEDTDSFCALIGYVVGLAEMQGVALRAGIDWNRDWKLAARDPTQRLNDYPHLELWYGR